MNRPAALADLPDIASILAETPRPERLYQYTNPAGLLGISTSQTLWGGRVSDLNDRTEQKEIYRYFDILLDQFFDDDPDPKNARGVIAELNALRTMNDRTRSDSATAVPIYTVSLTTDPDTLDQWRGYCPRSGGVALGFFSSELDALCRKQDYFLAKCSYSNYEDAKMLIDKVLVHCTEKIHGANVREATNEALESNAERFAVLVFQYLALLAPLFKHKSFESEREWRLISGPADASKLIPVASQTGLKLYLPFHLSSENLSVTSVECTVGPNLDPAGMMAATKVVLERHFKDVTLLATETPYR